MILMAPPTGETKKEKTSPLLRVKGKRVKGVAPSKVGKSRNYEIAPGIMRFSKARMYHKKAMYKKVKHGKRPKQAGPSKKPLFVEKKIGGEKNNSTRLVRIKKLPQYYHAEGDKKPRQRRKTGKFIKRQKLRKSLVPGTICIVLAGRHKGRRVVFLKQLPSGLLLVTGPYRVNRCPLRRINQNYVIATQTRLDVSGVKLPDNMDDNYFRRILLNKARKKDEDIFDTKKEKYQVSEQRKKDQKEVDDQVFAALKKHKERRLVRQYLATGFSLRHGMLPHAMKF
ncbi:unnamed protein product [Darwinula stevensoni]|uniref:Large ribosomal subunit protein eL6 n=1 Tax=Darwinula stevensoni TaxID=69355 RepID=A0A7R8XGR3_9CRUS|nr:unnamed protein product [Darwinula stevensoni]CAG0891958.1 unnamed protein product [Darwinula stevensoni]